MAKVQLVDGKIVTAPLTNIKHVGDEGARSATAHINGRSFPVYNSIVDGFSDIWIEQLSLEQWKAMKQAEQARLDSMAEEI